MKQLEQKDIKIALDRLNAEIEQKQRTVDHYQGELDSLKNVAELLESLLGSQ